jgi:hypothetical protein
VVVLQILQKFQVRLPAAYHMGKLETVYTPFLAPKYPLPFSLTPRGVTEATPPGSPRFTTKEYPRSSSSRISIKDKE